MRRFPLKKVVKASISLFFLVFWMFFSSVKTHAAEFSTDYDVSYTISEDGEASVQTNIKLTNEITNLFATQYSLSVKSMNMDNVSGYDSKGPLKIRVDKSRGESKLTAQLNDKVVGKGNTQSLTLLYHTQNISTHVGQIWEVTLPQMSSDAGINHYSVHLSVPQSFGTPLYFKSEPSQTDGRTYTWQYDQVTPQTIIASFGSGQTFSFSLKYHLYNDGDHESTMQIALPPDTLYQKMNYTSLSPSPLDVVMDDDGNWLANYALGSGKKMDIVAEGLVQVFGDPRKEFFQAHDGDDLHGDLLSTDYWPVDEPQIADLARKLKTPQAIYDYVTSTLSYDYARVTTNPERLGAIKALQNPQRAICMEFTDLTVALLRAVGIPAREINGFAFTNNTQLRPLSLLVDVLHAWPEYYDSDRRIWVPIDPTWGHTTGGVDYFSSLDLAHIAFVIHGASSIYPRPAGAYKLATKEENGKKGKDIDVRLSSKEASLSHLPLIVRMELPSGVLFSEGDIRIHVENPNGVAIYGTTVTITGDQVVVTPNSFPLPVLPPWGKKDFTVKAQTHGWLPFKAGNIRVEAGGAVASGTLTTQPPLVLAFCALLLVLLAMGIALYRRRS